MMKLRFAAPEVLVDINNVPGLDHLTLAEDGSIQVGALCRHADLERSSSLAQRQPTMAAAAPLVADPIVRSRGTLVGSLCHADPQGDWASVMISLDAHVVAQGPRGRRTIPVRSLVTGPFQNALDYDEIAIEAVIPAPQGEPAGGYLKLERRVGDFATAGVAVSVDRSGATINRAGIGLTGVGSSTISADAAAQALSGESLRPEVIDEVADLAAQAADPHTDHRGSASYKRGLVRVFTHRILTGLARGEEEAA